MAVSLTRTQLAVALRITTAETDTIPDGQAAVLDRLLASAQALVEGYAPDAPEPQQNEAAIRVAAHLYDSDPSATRRVASPMLYSAAAALLAPWRTRRLVGSTGESSTTAVDAAGGGRLTETLIASVNVAASPANPSIGTVALASTAPTGFAAETASGGIRYPFAPPAGAIGLSIKVKVSGTVVGCVFSPYGASVHGHPAVLGAPTQQATALFLPSSASSGMVLDVEINASGYYRIGIDNGQYWGSQPASTVEYYLVGGGS